MRENQVSYPRALKKAQQAAKRGDKAQAQYWAEFAAAVAPDQETAWLLLGDLAELDERVGFYTRAVEANPTSQIARQRLAKAVRQLRRSQSQTSFKLLPNIRLGVPFAATIQRKGSIRAAMLSLFAAATLGLTAWVGVSWMPALGDPAVGIFHTQTPQALLAMRENLLTSTPTPTATATMTPTPTPTATATPRPTRTVPPPTAAPQSGYGQRPWHIGSTEFWLEVDLGDQRLIAHRGDQILEIFIISSGTWQTPTITGSFQIHSKVNSQTMAGSDFYLPDVPFVMYFYKDYAIHGTYWHTNFGTPMSHGCVNMATGDAGWVYQSAEVGTWVIIHP